MSFTFGGIAVGNPFVSILPSFLTFFLFTGREIFKDVQDVKGDFFTRKMLLMKIGKKAVFVASIFLIVAVMLSPLPFLLNQIGIGYLIIIIMVDVLVFYIIKQNLKDLRNTEISVKSY